jgi:hypothetical protein
MKRLFLKLTLILFVIPFGMSQDLPSYVPTNGLVAYYPFNGNANDESESGYHGAVNGATLTTDRFENIEKAYSYNGKDTFISLPNDFFDGTENGTYTINFWTKNFQGGSKIFYKGGSWKDLSIDIISDYKVKYSFRNGTNTALNNLTSNTSLEQDKWYNITIRQESGEIDLYLNGTFDAQLQTNDVVDWSTSINTPCAGVGMHFGKNYNNCTVDVGYYGVIDDFGIWDRALTEEEIQNLYTSSTGDIILNGIVSAENNQIKNIANPTDAQDAVTLNYLENGNFYTQNQVDNLLDDLRDELGNQIDNDGDGYTEDDGDCNDSNNLIFPGASEFEDGIDNDCDGEIDESAVYEFNHPANFLNGLIAYYPFTDGSTEDFSGNGNHGIANNVNSNQDRFGTSDAALYFTNTGTTGDSFVSVTNLETTSVSSGLTISLWAKIDGEGLNIPRIIDFGSNNEIGSLYIQAPNGDNYTQTRYNAPSNTYQRHVFHNNNGQWNQYAFSAHSDGQYRIYLNGQLDRMIQISQGELSLADLLSIGASNDGVHAFRGWIDDVSIHNRVLADNEILAIFNMQE